MGLLSTLQTEKKSKVLWKKLSTRFGWDPNVGPSDGKLAIMTIIQKGIIFSYLGFVWYVFSFFVLVSWLFTLLKLKL